MVCHLAILVWVAWITEQRLHIQNNYYQESGHCKISVVCCFNFFPIIAGTNAHSVGSNCMLMTTVTPQLQVYRSAVGTLLVVYDVTVNIWVWITDVLFLFKHSWIIHWFSVPTVIERWEPVPLRRLSPSESLPMEILCQYF